jgi:hypothetical protein
MERKPPYENMQIGQFLVSFGYELKSMGYENYASINLYQQSPPDTKVGDLMTDLGGKCFIIEFKRGLKEIGAELAKENKKRFIKSLNKTELSISGKCHFLSHGKMIGERQVQLAFNPYAFHFNRSSTDFPFPMFGVKDFVKQLMEGNIGVSTDLMRNYLKKLDTTSSGMKNSSALSAIVMHIDDDNGFSYYQIDDYLDLELNIAPELSQSKNLNPRISKGLLPGESRDLNI